MWRKCLHYLKHFLAHFKYSLSVIITMRGMTGWSLHCHLPWCFHNLLSCTEKLTHVTNWMVAVAVTLWYQGRVKTSRCSMRMYVPLFSFAKRTSLWELDSLQSAGHWKMLPRSDCLLYTIHTPWSVMPPQWARMQCLSWGWVSSQVRNRKFQCPHSLGTKIENICP